MRNIERCSRVWPPSVLLSHMKTIPPADGMGVMKRIAAPLVGGMISAPLRYLFLIPALYGAWLNRGKQS